MLFRSSLLSCRQACIIIICWMLPVLLFRSLFESPGLSCTELSCVNYWLLAVLLGLLLAMPSPHHASRIACWSLKLFSLSELSTTLVRFTAFF